MVNVISKITTPLLLLSAATAVTAADVELFTDPDSCSATSGGVCRNVAGNTCCLVTNHLWGSGGVGFVNTGTLQLYSKQGNNYCNIAITQEYNTPVCIESGLDASVGGAVYRSHRLSKRMESEEFVNQQAELMTVKDGKQYIISLDKQATIPEFEPVQGQNLSTYSQNLSTYVIQHADIVRHYDNNSKLQDVVEAAGAEAPK